MLEGTGDMTRLVANGDGDRDPGGGTSSMGRFNEYDDVGPPGRGEAP